MSWLKPFEALDVEVLLPLMFDGLRETENPYCILAVKASCVSKNDEVGGNEHEKRHVMRI